MEFLKNENHSKSKGLFLKDTLMPGFISLQDTAYLLIYPDN